MYKIPIDKINHQDEALCILSALGFLVRDWPFIKKIGGPVKLLESDLIHKYVIKNHSENLFLHNRLKKLREGFDTFYQSDGTLLSIINSPECKLFKAARAPLVFYMRGNKKILNQTPVVSIVGSRQACISAIKQTGDLASTLAQNNIVVASGGAIGIDQAAHRGSLLSGGTSILISGETAKFNLAKNSKALSFSKEKNLLTLHPFGPFLPQSKYMFVERNRFVCSIADALVVVQGGKKSGTLHSAKFAYEQKIPIHAIPGAVTDELSYAPNYLLANNKALALINWQDFANKINKVMSKPAKKLEVKATIKEDLPYILKTIHQHNNSLGLDELMRITGKSYGDLQKEMLDYQLEGKVIKEGTQFVLTGK